jgi:hypothetical protein
MAAVDAGWLAGLLLIVGSTVFLVGAAIAVPRVFMETDPTARLRMLEERIRIWRAGQSFYALGPIIAGIGVVVLAADASDGDMVLFGIAGTALVVGALAWSWSVYLRATRVRDFALGNLPWWPFATYVLLTIGGLALLGIGLLAGYYVAWLGWLTLAADVMFLGLYLATKDIPPFVFYLLLLVVGIAIV